MNAAHLLRRRPARWIALLMFLTVLWLLLPRLLGAAIGHWLALPGVDGLQVEFETVAPSEVRLARLAANYHSPSGDRVRFDLQGVVLEYSALRRHVDRARIAQASVTIEPSAAPPEGDWPRLELPRIPLSQLSVDQLQLRVLRAGQAPVAVTVALEGARAAEGSVQITATHPQGRLELSAAPEDSAHSPGVQAQLRWQPVSGPEARLSLRLAAQPNARPVLIDAQMPLPALVSLAETMGLTLPVSTAQGLVRLKAEADLGAHSAAGAAKISALRGDLGVDGLALDAEHAGRSWALNGAGSVHFDIADTRADLTLKAGSRWQLESRDASLLKFRVQPEKDVGIAWGKTKSSENRASLSNTPLPVVISSAAWGNWEGRLDQLEVAVGERWGDLRLLKAGVQFLGGVAKGLKPPLRFRNLRADGRIDLAWQSLAGGESSITANVHSQSKFDVLAVEGKHAATLDQLVLETVGSAKLQHAASGWQLAAIEANVSSPKLHLSLGVQQWSTGPVRIGVRSAQPDARQADVQLDVGALRNAAWPDWPAPDVHANVRWQGDALAVKGKLAHKLASLAEFSARGRMATQCAEGEVSAQHSLSSLNGLLQPRPRTLKALELQSGALNAAFKFAWCAGTAPPKLSGTFALRDAGVAWDKARAEHLNADVVLDGVAPLRGSLQLRLPQAQLGAGLTLARTELDARLGESSLALDRLQAELLGGTLSSPPVRWAWPLERPQLVLDVKEFDLGQMLALVNVEGLSGSGRLSGKLPLVMHAQGVEIKDGGLSSVLAGVIRYAPTVAIADNPGLQALRNFQYSRVDLGIQYDPDGRYRLRTRLLGKNPDFYSGYPIGMTLNVNGALPGVFRAALFSGDFNRHILEQLQSGKLQ